MEKRLKLVIQRQGGKHRKLINTGVKSHFNIKC